MQKTVNLLFTYKRKLQKLKSIFLLNCRNTYIVLIYLELHFFSFAGKTMCSTAPYSHIGRSIMLHSFGSSKLTHYRCNPYLKH